MTTKIIALLFLFITIKNCQSFNDSRESFSDNDSDTIDNTNGINIGNTVNIIDGSICVIKDGKIYLNGKFLRNVTAEDRQKLAEYQAQVQEWSRNLSANIQQSFPWNPQNPQHNNFPWNPNGPGAPWRSFPWHAQNPEHNNFPWNPNGPGSPSRSFPWNPQNPEHNNFPWNPNGPNAPWRSFPWNNNNSNRYVRSTKRMERVRRSQMPFPKFPDICG